MPTNLSAKLALVVVTIASISAQSNNGGGGNGNGNGGGGGGGNGGGGGSGGGGNNNNNNNSNNNNNNGGGGGGGGSGGGGGGGRGGGRGDRRINGSASSWRSWMSSEGKSYSGVEEQHRWGNFNATVAAVLAHNDDVSATWSMGINQFSDLSADEFAALTSTRGLIGKCAPPISTLPLLAA